MTCAVGNEMLDGIKCAVYLYKHHLKINNIYQKLRISVTEMTEPPSGIYVTRLVI